MGGRSDRYVVGEAVAANYNPLDPRDAVIETPFPFVAAMGIVVVAILLGIGWHIYVTQLRMPPGGVVARDVSTPAAAGERECQGSLMVSRGLHSPPAASHFASRLSSRPQTAEPREMRAAHVFAQQV